MVVDYKLCVKSFPEDKKSVAETLGCLLTIWSDRRLVTLQHDLPAVSSYRITRAEMQSVLHAAIREEIDSGVEIRPSCGCQLI